MRKPASTRISATGRPESGKLPDSRELRNTWVLIFEIKLSKKLRTNLIDIWEHVGEARCEDDAPAKHGEAGEQGHHGGRLQKRRESI